MCPLIKEGVRRNQTEGETKRESGGWVGWGAPEWVREKEKNKKRERTVQ